MHYLDYLQKKEKKILFKIHKFSVSHGHFSGFIRGAKGWLLGFGLGHIIVKREVFMILAVSMFVVSFLLSWVAVNYQKRHYNRKGWKDSLRILSIISGFCLLMSMLTLIYGSIITLLVVLSTSILFAALAYSFE